MQGAVAPSTCSTTLTSGVESILRVVHPGLWPLIETFRLVLRRFHPQAMISHTYKSSAQTNAHGLL
jgi:hypothetical protein